MMELPFFFTEHMSPQDGLITLSEEASKHAVQVLRLRAGDALQLTDGRGCRVAAHIEDPHKKRCLIRVTQLEQQERQGAQRAIGISLLKNAARFEWFLEKATELGITRIHPLVCRRTERTSFRSDRMRQILVSAMLQSQQVWLPEMSEPLPLAAFLPQCHDYDTKRIAHCGPGEKQRLEKPAAEQSAIVLIGPEGDFTGEEVNLAQEQGFVPISLGDTRLRTETAGIAAAVWMR